MPSYKKTKLIIVVNIINEGSSSSGEIGVHGQPPLVVLFGSGARYVHRKIIRSPLRKPVCGFNFVLSLLLYQQRAVN